MNYKLSLVIPTFNEEGNIEKLLNKTHDVLKNNAITHELIIVDDGSTDQTRAIIRKLQKEVPEIILIPRDNERGLASALVRGYNNARGKYFGSMDADLAHDPKHLPEMLEILEKNKADFVIGSRYIKDAQFTGKPFMNKLASLVGQMLIKIILGVTAKDTSNNYRIFRREIWERIKNNLHPEGNIMITEIVYLAQKNNFRIIEIPIEYVERRVGKSKLSILQETKSFFKNIYRIKRRL
ncbi:hypothetical protein A3J56_01795 [Candidatus Giovannonibacteria bacterium RIFCSPHIGHO2_02_FULL_46_20]|uniref:Glycosyltransferase 2-like domain-containing protein n=1 Tax=Candidatus Giovannonibacteria bacterium RIFCSPHIGHO2_02_FULL_46_20 TaxID=1798338 RepID=A0A1F5WEK4_9BACT|nr:MAG: hypothetical protein A3J56_01795 [Candidatus Giovannonibacteria bacterium RIFCSPHIGHO2_02_FULL_46_20]